MRFDDLPLLRGGELMVRCQFCRRSNAEYRWGIAVCALCEVVLHNFKQSCPADCPGTIDRCTHCDLIPNKIMKRGE